MTAVPRRPLRWYRGAPLGARVHVALRWATAPFGALDRLLPASGRILDWGCGHGVHTLWLAANGASRVVEGRDIDGAKLATARAAAETAGLGARATFATVAPEELPVGQWDGVVIDDVLYLLDPAAQQRLVHAAAGTLLPGGVLVCKEMGEQPRWKHRLTTLQERVVVRRLGLTATADGLQPFPPPATVAAWMRAQGLEVEVVPIDRGYHVPHVAVVGHRR